ncbi:hypothetical protein SESBI_34113 [Sesbania bispinosa]|nr:hypothetical protein SESBI_34113 [Sesbania bispinosa]
MAFRLDVIMLTNLVRTSLIDFVNQVGVAVNIRNQAGDEARMRQKYHNHQIRTGFPLEEHAASIFTPYAFELLQHEIQLSTKYAAIEAGNDSYIVRHHTKVDGGRFVNWIEEEESIHCSFRCLEVESLKTKDRVEVATKELGKVIQIIKSMPKIQEKSTEMERDVPNHSGCEVEVENPIISKTKGRPKGSRPKGGVEVAKKPRRCHYPNCGGTNHDSRNCPNKKNNIEILPSQSPNKMAKGWRRPS